MVRELNIVNQGRLYRGLICYIVTVCLIVIHSINIIDYFHIDHNELYHKDTVW